MKNLYARLLCVTALLLVGSVTGSTVEAKPTNILYTSAPNPVGSGARAMGMGGAFIAIADDATAASWNPAGLVQLKRPEMSAVGSFVYRNEDFENFSSEYWDRTLSDSTVSLYELNYLSVVLPFSLWNRNMVVSLNYQRLYDYASKSEISAQGQGENIRIERKVEGCLSPIGLAYSLQITPSLKWGVTFNFWRKYGDINVLKEKYNMYGNIEGIDFETDSITEHRFRGFNVHTGILWQPTEKIGIGAVFKSPFTATIKAESTEVTNWITIPLPPESSSLKTEKELKMPCAYGVGLHYKINDSMRMAVDFYQTEWDDYIYIDKDGEEDGEYSAVTGTLSKDTDIDPTRQVRLGMEYLITHPQRYRSFPIRFGVFYDPIPDKGSPVDAFGGSAGIGMSTSRFSIDGFYQYKFTVNDSSVSQYKEYFPCDVKEHTVYLSFIYYL